MHDFRVWLKAQRYAPATIRGYSAYILRASKALDLGHATTDELTAWCSTLTPNCAIGARKALISWYTYRGKTIRTNPALEIVVPPNPKRRPRAHTAEEWQQFIAAARRLGGIHEAVGHLYAWTAARFSSVRFARWHQFDLAGTEPTWQAIVKAANRSGPRTHEIPLHPHLVEVLHRWRRNSASGRDWLFPGHSPGGVIGARLLRDTYKEVAAEIDLTSVPHQQRHTLATALYDHTGDPIMVKEVLGHADLNTTNTYIRVSARKTRAALVGLPSL